MNRKLRRRHLFVWGTLGIVLPVAFLLALAFRRAMPVEKSLPVPLATEGRR